MASTRRNGFHQKECTRGRVFYVFYIIEIVEIAFCTCCIKRTCWLNSFSFKLKTQKMNRHFLGQMRYFRTNLNIFHTNSNNNLKNGCHSKIIIGNTIFQLLLVSTFFLKLSLLLNSSIR